MQSPENKNKRSLEKEFFTKGPQSLSIKELLQIPSEFRTYTHCKEIINHVKNVRFLDNYMDSEHIFDLVKEFKIVSYKANLTVFNQGDPGDAFYIILSGSVRVFINRPSENKHAPILQEIQRLHKGDAFGELALLYDSFRTATIITAKPTDLIVLDKESFRKHIRSVQTVHIGHIIEFYKNFMPFQSLQPNEIAALAGKSIIHKYPSNSVIIKQGDKPENAYYVKSGRLKVVKKIDFMINPVTKKLLHDDVSDPTPEDIKNGRAKTLVIEIDELSIIGNGDSFADYAILNDEVMKCTVISTIPCELIVLPHYEITNLSKYNLKEYQSLCKPYPDDRELRRIYLDLIKWDIWKKRLYRNILIELDNKKLGFNGQLRQPFKRVLPLNEIEIQVDDAKHEMIDMLANLDAKNSSSTYLKNLTIDDSFTANATRQGYYYSSHHPKHKRNSSSLQSSTIISNHNRSKSEVKLSSLQSPTSTMKQFSYVKPKHRLRNQKDPIEEKEEKKQEEIKPSTQFDQMLAQSKLSIPLGEMFVKNKIVEKGKKQVGFVEPGSPIKSLDKLFVEVGFDRQIEKLPPIIKSHVRKSKLL